MNNQVVIALYRSFLQNARKFQNYNFREYARRKIKYEFQKGKALKEEAAIQRLYREGQEKLELLRRQVIISSLYPEEMSVIEKRIKR